MRPIERQLAVMTTPWVRDAMTPEERAGFDAFVSDGPGWGVRDRRPTVSLLAVKRGGPFVGRMYHPVTGRELRAESVTLAGVLRRLIEQVDGVTA